VEGPGCKSKEIGGFLCKKHAAKAGGADLIHWIKIRWWWRLAGMALRVDPREPGLRSTRAVRLPSSGPGCARAPRRQRPADGGAVTAVPSGCSPTQQGPGAGVPHLPRTSRRGGADERANYTRAPGRTPERRRQRTVRRSGRPRRSKSGDPSSALRSAAMTTDGTIGSLTLRRSSGRLPQRRQGGDGAKLRQWRR
jgi:hypothetical protein